MAPRTRPTPEETAAAFVQVPGTARELVVGVDPLTEDESAEDDIANKVRVAVAGHAGDEVRAKLFRRHPHTRKLEWCDNYAPEDMMTDPHGIVRDAWGPGVYEIRLYGSTGSLGNFRLDVAAPPVNRFAQPPAPAPVPAVSDALAGVLERMADMQGQILARLSAPPPPAPPPMGIQDMLGIFAAVQGLMPKPAPAEDIMQTFAKLKALKGIAQELNPVPETDPENPMPMVNGLLSVMAEAMRARNGGTAPQAPQPMLGLTVPQSMADARAPVQTAAQNPADTAPTTQEETSRLFLEGLAAGVIERAMSHTPPQACAEWLADVLPDDFLPMLKMPNWLDMLCAAMPTLAPHRDYLTAVKPLLDAEFVE